MGEMAGMEANRNPGMKFYLIVWNGLLYIAGAEVFLTYWGLSTRVLLAVLLTLAFVEAGLGLLYFMHLKFEGKLIYVILFVPLALCVILVLALIPDVFMTDPIRNAASSSLHLFNPITAFFNGFGK